MTLLFAQAMDRCHRIGQTKPVLVFRLATAHSVEGQLLRRANKKLALERLVIKRGAFMSEDADEAKNSGLGAEELLKLLESKASQSDKTQSGAISDQVGGIHSAGSTLFTSPDLVLCPQPNLHLGLDVAAATRLMLVAC